MEKCYHEVEHAIPMICRLTENRTTLSPPRASRAELITRMALSQPEASGTVQKPYEDLGKPVTSRAGRDVVGCYLWPGAPTSLWDVVGCYLPGGLYWH